MKVCVCVCVCLCARATPLVLPSLPPCTALSLGHACSTRTLISGTTEITVWKEGGHSNTDALLAHTHTQTHTLIKNYIFMGV